MTDERLTAITSELRELRKGTGLTRAKLLKCPEILKCLEGESLNEAYEELIKLIHGLDAGIKSDAIKSAFGLGEGLSAFLTDRRNDFGELHGRHTDTVEAYENEMISELAVELRSDITITKLDNERTCIKLVASMGCLVEAMVVVDYDIIVSNDFENGRTSFIYQNRTGSWQFFSFECQYVNAQSETRLNEDETCFAVSIGSTLNDVQRNQPIDRYYYKSEWTLDEFGDGILRRGVSLENGAFVEMRLIIVYQNNTPEGSMPLSSS